MRSKRWLWLAIVLAVVFAAAVAANWWVLWGRKAGIEAHMMGDIILLFVYDHDRVPSSIEELVEQEYLVRNAEGEVWTGPRSLDRPDNSWSPPGQEMLFQHIDKFIFRPDEAVEGRGFFRSPESEVVDSYAKHYSSIIRLMLTEEIHKKPGQSWPRDQGYQWDEDQGARASQDRQGGECHAPVPGSLV